MGFYNQLLYEKAKDEYEKFLEVLYKRPIEEVIELSYEKYVKRSLFPKQKQTLF